MAAAAAAAGAAVAILGGLIGLGGAEFRLPLLIGIFALYAQTNKQVLLSDVAKAVYKSKKDDLRQDCLKVKAVIVGLNMTIDAYELPFQHVTFEGRGEEATLMLATKSAAKRKPAAKAKKVASVAA